MRIIYCEYHNSYNWSASLPLFRLINPLLLFLQLIVLISSMAAVLKIVVVVLALVGASRAACFQGVSNGDPGKVFTSGSYCLIYSVKVTI